MNKCIPSSKHIYQIIISVSKIFNFAQQNILNKMYQSIIITNIIQQWCVTAGERFINITRLKNIRFEHSVETVTLPVIELSTHSCYSTCFVQSLFLGLTLHILLTYCHNVDTFAAKKGNKPNSSRLRTIILFKFQWVTRKGLLFVVYKLILYKYSISSETTLYLDS